MVSMKGWNLLALGLAATGVVAQNHSANEPVRDVYLNVPYELYSVKRPIDGSWQSFSIEGGYMVDFFGNLSHPNTLTQNLLANLANLSGTNNIIRFGGSTSNNVTYDAEQEEAIVNVFEISENAGLTNPGGDQPTNSTVGPAWFESFMTAPEGTRYIYTLNWRDNSEEGIETTMEDAQRVVDHLGDTLYAFALGNEIERWGGRYRDEDWSPEVYTREWLQYVDRMVERGILNTSSMPAMQMGALMGSGNASYNEPWNSETLLRSGINARGYVKAAAQHDYHGNNCASTDEIAQLRQNLLNHTNIANRGGPHRYLAPVVDSAGIEYVLGETNSISCQGREDVSNVWGSALWYLDYNLYIASQIPAVASMYFHMGTPYRYSLWAPFADAGLEASALIRPSYYGAWALAEAIGGHGGSKQVHAVVEEESLVAYALYAAGALDGVWVVNMGEWNVSMAVEGERRPFMRFELPEGIDREARVKRLTAPGTDVKDGGTWGGQRLDDAGLVVGDELVERWMPGDVVNVGVGEAVYMSWSE
ncbi:hypothetical protein MBLNU230_g5694t1 [Neophaeotheca triangularis]